MTKNMTCIACPLGCQLTVEYEGENVLSVTGNTCKRGDKYARTEIVCPTRSLTSTMKVIGGIHPVVPVKTSQAVPKTMMFDIMEEINAVTVNAPIAIGQVLIHDVLGTGADIIATNIN